MNPTSDWILDVLDCTDATMERIAAIQERCLERFSELFVTSMTRHAGHRLVDRIVCDYNRLSTSGRARLLMSGGFFELASRVNTSVEPLAVESSLLDLAELIQRDLQVNELADLQDESLLAETGDLRVWNAMGDRVAVKNGCSWEIEKPDRIGGAISLDYDSPIALAHEVRSGTLSRPRLSLSNEDREIVHEKLQTALSTIDKAEPLYGALIRNFTRRIVIRKSVERDDLTSPERLVSSEHVSRQPGCIRMLNVHLDEKTMASCMESLLHESIHVFMSSIEIARGSFYTSRSLQRRPISPWSGNPIPNSAYSHAIFIYYACRRLFNTALHKIDDLEESTRKVMTSRLQFIDAGFMVDQRLVDLFLETDKLDKKLVAAIDAVQDRSRRLPHLQMS